MKNKQSLIYLVLIFFLSLLAVKALFHPGFYTSHDGRHQIIRLMHFHQGLMDGQLPVRWAGTALSGYGYPLFIFTYRLPFWLAEGWYLISHNLGAAIRFVFIITFFTSGLAMYFFASQLYSSKLAGFLSALLYLWAPYRLVNIFVRAALGEAVAFTFIPLIFLGLFILAQKRRRRLSWVVFLSLSLSGLLLSHAITLVLWLVPLVLWFAFNWYQSKERRDFLGASFLASLASLFLTAYYWLPAALERKYTQFLGTIGSYYQAHFVTFKQLLYSPWGYGFSLPGAENDMMSFQVGIAQWLVVFTSIFLVVFFLLQSIFRKLKIRIKGYRRFLFKKFVFKEKITLLLIYFLTLFFFSISLMLSSSERVYAFINRLFTIDIPWRFLGVAVFSSSLLFGALLILIKDNLIKTFLVMMVLFLAFYGNRNHLKVNQYVYWPETEYWQSTETSNEYDDYTPRWFSSGEVDQTDPQLVSLEGKSKNKLIKRKSSLFRFSSQVESEKAEVMTKVAYYPGWQVFIDCQSTGKILHQDGKIKVNLDKGNHLVSLIFRETRLRRLANYLSLLTLVVLIGFWVKDAKKK
jgi:hypothetical protein